MVERGDIYEHGEVQAKLTVPFIPNDDDDEETVRFTFGALLSVNGCVFAHVEPWPNYELSDGQLFEDEGEAARCGDALLRRLGFVPAETAASKSK